MRNIPDNALLDLNKQRDENLHQKLDEVKEEVFNHINKRFNEIPDHAQMSLETRKRIEKLEIDSIKISMKLDQLIILMEENNKKTNDVYEVYTSSGWTYKMLLKILLFVGALGGAILGGRECYKLLK